MKISTESNQTAFAVPLKGPGRLWTELSILFRIQCAIVRDSWAWVVLMGTMFPLSTVLFMKFFAENPSEEMMIRIIAGNLIFGVIVMGMNSMGQEISWQKHEGHFTYYASLPISKMNFVLANLFRGLLNTIPSFILLGLIGQLIYGIQFHYSWGLPLVVILSLASVVGIGVCIGFWSPNHQLTNMLVQALMLLVTFLSPVMVEIHQLPLPLQWLSYIFPTTYAADAMRNVLVTGWSGGVMLDCVVLLGYSLVTIVLINKMVNWRVKN
ncbi:ABC transporter permease [Paenibacillus sp. sptzw28]|uniref:ABC transporter permease n=1 Tax=Paenibacillus sp. sptzw28 TaxID=715179 RepID=UPI001C6E81BE|nr:ABC transporter permease [Paenibacillus sp. sptzw28]QYR19608.1 ABC transporter permease [Paenibacillus sp. sptzw28]